VLTAKPWKVEAIVRLVLSVVLCMFAGSLVLSAMHYAESRKHVSPWYFVLAAFALGLLGLALAAIRKAQNPDHVLRRIILVAFSFYGGLLLCFWAEHIAGPLPEGMTASQVIISGLSLQGAALVLLVFFVREHGLGFSEAFGFRKRLGRALLAGVLAGALMLPPAQLLLYGSAELMHRCHLKAEPQAAVQALTVTDSWAYRISLAVYALLLAPAAEEMLFRGILYPLIKQAGFPRLALFGTALLFAAIHLNMQSFLPLFVLALVLTLLYEVTDNLATSITAHALFNLMNFAQFFLPG
jgi:membrane protease YdiL (CAAX protease family)